MKSGEKKDESGSTPADSDKISSENSSGIKDKVRSKSLFTLVRELVRPYRKWLIIVFIAMLIETAMSLAAPWPLKIILDNVV